ncbi:MAG: DUF4065 domain-containing protein [Chitinophagales bacterium]|nr:DUF4065 domain-containing protein [Chitinophagales bacterium]
MKSPFTGGEVVLVRESRELEYRKERFQVQYHFYKCVDTGDSFTTDELDNINIIQVHNRYREKYRIPFVDEVRHIREQYDLTAVKMSEVLGLGINMYRNYESGEMPTLAHGHLLSIAADPVQFEQLFEKRRSGFTDSEYERVKKKLARVKTNPAFINDLQVQHVFKIVPPCIFNGYRSLVWEKLGNMVRYFAGENTPFITGMNKYLFFADFLHYKLHGTGISGLCYRALQRGPVPENYGMIYNYLVNGQYVAVEEVDFGNYAGERLIPVESAMHDSIQKHFTLSEWSVLQQVAARLKHLSTKKIVDISHNEKAWLENYKELKQISFDYGFELCSF